MTVQAAKLGILMLDTQFPRIVGDVGNPASFAFGVRYHSVKGATPAAIVEGDQTPFVDAFIAAGRALLAEGCTGIATTCGFLSLRRQQFADALGVPVAASALEQLGLVNANLPGNRRAGVLTISAHSLSADHLRLAGAPADTPVEGMEGTHFADAILQNRPDLDVDRARSEMVARAVAFARSRPDLGALVLECTNMPPYADDISAATGLPVHSIITYLGWFEAGLPAPTSGGS